MFLIVISADYSLLSFAIVNINFLEIAIFCPSPICFRLDMVMHDVHF